MTQYLFGGENFEKFVAKSIQEETRSKVVFEENELNGLVNPNFDNFLYRNGYEIYIKYENGVGYTFEINKLPKKLTNFNFGVELETCFILNCEKDDYFDKKLYNKTLSSGNDWSYLITLYLMNTIVPDLSEEFLELYEYASIFPSYHSDNNNLVLNLRTNKLMGAIPISDYKTLIFEPDGSIECDFDNDKLLPIPCEIVSPVLRNVSELEILLKGLKISPKCNQSNKSTGFHINVSVEDETGQMVKLTKGMLLALIDNWMDFEKKNYVKLRGKEGSEYAKKLRSIIETKQSILKGFEKGKILNKEGNELEIDEYYTPFGLGYFAILKTISKMWSGKTYAFTNHKNNNVIEFRVFNSRNEIEPLLHYIDDAVTVMKSAFESYIKNPMKNILQIQNNCLNYTIEKQEYKIPIPEITPKNSDMMDNGYIWVYWLLRQLEIDYSDINNFIDIKLFKIEKPIFGKVKYNRLRDVFNREKITNLKNVKAYIVYTNNLTLTREHYFYDFIVKNDNFVIKNPVKINEVDIPESLLM